MHIRYLKPARFLPRDYLTRWRPHGYDRGHHPRAGPTLLQGCKPSVQLLLQQVDAICHHAGAIQKEIHPPWLCRSAHSQALSHCFPSSKPPIRSQATATCAKKVRVSAPTAGPPRAETGTQSPPRVSISTIHCHSTSDQNSRQAIAPPGYRMAAAEAQPWPHRLRQPEPIHWRSKPIVTPI